MDINQQKEQFSSTFVRVVASVAGYALYKPEVDEDSKVTIMGVIVGKLRRIQLELAEPVYELAVKAYQARIPVICQGDLAKKGNYFVLQNPHQFTLDLEAWVS